MNAESSSNVWRLSLPAGAWAVAGLLSALLAAGCGSVPKTYYYTLQVPPPPAPSEVRTTYVLGVEHFRAPEMLRDDRVIYYVSPTQVNFYQNHRWGSDPATLLSEYAAQWMDSTGVFTQVRMLPVREHVDYTLGGRVLDFEEVDSSGTPQVRLALELSLMRTSDRKLVWSGQQHQEMPLSGPGVEGVATALNSASAQVMREMAPTIIAQVEQDYKSGGK